MRTSCFSSAVRFGEFDAWLINTVTRTWHWAGSSAPTTSTTYTQSFLTATISDGTYTATVYYRPDATVWGELADRSLEPHRRGDDAVTGQ